MPALRELVAGLGATNAATYLQSGNVVFRSEEPPAALADAIRAAVERELGLDVAVILRSRDEIKRIVTHNPFLAAGADPATLHLAFLDEEPEPAALQIALTQDTGPDELRVAGRDVYLRYPGGYGRTKLSNAFLERHLRVTATTRNWRTVTALAELMP
jgi:uncharacterized protein (DUF1697 family)